MTNRQPPKTCVQSPQPTPCTQRSPRIRQKKLKYQQKSFFHNQQTQSYRNDKEYKTGKVHSSLNSNRNFIDQKIASPRIQMKSTSSKLSSILKNDLQLEAQLLKLNMQRVNKPMKKSSLNTNPTSLFQGVEKVSFQQIFALQEQSIAPEDKQPSGNISHSIDFSINSQNFHRPARLTMPTTPAVTSLNKRMGKFHNPLQQDQDCFGRAKVFTPPPVNFKQVDWGFNFSKNDVTKKKSVLSSLLSDQRDNARAQTTLNWDINDVDEPHKSKNSLLTNVNKARFQPFNAQAVQIDRKPNFQGKITPLRLNDIESLNLVADLDSSRYGYLEKSKFRTTNVSPEYNSPQDKIVRINNEICSMNSSQQFTVINTTDNLPSFNNSSLGERIEYLQQHPQKEINNSFLKTLDVNKLNLLLATPKVHPTQCMSLDRARALLNQQLVGKPKEQPKPKKIQPPSPKVKPGKKIDSIGGAALQLAKQKINNKPLVPKILSDEQKQARIQSRARKLIIMFQRRHRFKKVNPLRYRYDDHMLNPMLGYSEKYNQAVEFIQYCKSRPKNSRLSKNQMRKMFLNMDQLVKLEHQAKKDRIQDFNDQLHDFTLDHDDIKDVHSKKFKHVKGEMDEIKLVLGFIDHFSESQKMSNFKERNSIILEMLDQNKNDRDFGKQLMQAKKETKEFINQLIKTLDLQEENNSSEDSFEKQMLPSQTEEDSSEKLSSNSNSQIVATKNSEGSFYFNSDKFKSPPKNDHGTIDKELGQQMMKIQLKKYVQFQEATDDKGKVTLNQSLDLRQLFDGQRPQVTVNKSPTRKNNQNLLQVKFESGSDISEDLISNVSSMRSLAQENQSKNKMIKARTRKSTGSVVQYQFAKKKESLPSYGISIQQVESRDSNQSVSQTKTRESRPLKSPEESQPTKTRNSSMALEQIQQRDGVLENTASLQIKAPSRNLELVIAPQYSNSRTLRSPAKLKKKKTKQANFHVTTTVDKQKPCIQKFRALIAKHFLSKSLEELEKLDYNTLNVSFCLLMSHFKQTLNEIFPPQGTKSILQKYGKLGRNLYENEFMHELIGDIPALKNNVLLRSFKEHKNTKDDMVVQTSCNQMDLNSLFDNAVDKLKFYEQAKRGKLEVKEYEDINGTAVLNYFERLRDHKVLPIPNFVTFEKNTMYLSSRTITKQQGIALKEYMDSTKNIEDKRVHKLIIDSCNIRDEQLCMILHAIAEQSQKNQFTGAVIRQYLSSFIISNTFLGPKSIEYLKNLAPHILELTVNNVKTNFNHKQIHQSNLVETLLDYSKRLMKLKLSNINLNNDMLIENLSDMISNLRILQHFDISWSSISITQMITVTDSLLNRQRSIRHINLSYNRLNFVDPIERKLSLQVMENLFSLFEKAYVLCHLKLSGMNFDGEQIILLCKKLTKVQLLMSIHLNDNEINSNDELIDEVLDIFGLRKEDLIELNRQLAHPKQIYLRDREDLDRIKEREGYEAINYKKIIQTHLSTDGPIKSNLIKGYQIGKNQQRKLYKDHILMGKQSKIVEQHRAINLSAVHQGIGRLDNNSIDHFVVTRKVNYPEFIFNQKQKNDNIRGLRYFEKDHDLKWKLSKTNECFICEKWKYTIIFFEKGMFSKNPELVEIFDKDFISDLRLEFNRNYLKYKTLVPIICGSVVNRGFNQGIFDRKLKMMRASLFTLLSISHSREFTQSKLHSKFIKEAIIKFNQFDSDNVMNEINIYDRIDGWNELLNDKINNNELVDVTSINQPNLLDGYIQYKDVYCYAAFLPPGYHQLIIYDPQQERAFCKDIVISLNQKDFYPEFPLQTGYDAPKTIQNVWRTWTEDSQDDQIKSFISDTQQAEFQPHRFFRDEVDSNKCLDTLRDNFDFYKIYHKELLLGSSKFPQIDWENCWYNIDKRQQISPFLTIKKKRLIKAEIELAFIQSTRFDESRGLKSAMQRMELIEFLLRIAKTWSNKVYQKEPVADHFLEFLNIYIKPTHDESNILGHRKIIRGSAKLNSLLYMNQTGLEVIFKEYQLPKKGFTLDQAYKFFNQYEKLVEMGDLTLRKIEQSFMFSMMTVLNEHKNMKKYSYIVFVEFLEMICRIAILCINIQETVDFKVNMLLTMIYEHRYKTLKWQIDKWPLINSDDIDDSQYKIV